MELSSYMQPLCPYTFLFESSSDLPWDLHIFLYIYPNKNIESEVGYNYLVAISQVCTSKLTAIYSLNLSQ